MAFENNRYLIILTSEIDKCDFSELVTTSENTLRFSVDGNLTFIEWKDVVPQCVNNLSYSEGPYTQQEMLEILTSKIWTYDPEISNFNPPVTDEPQEAI